MIRDPSRKYRPFAPLALPERTWPCRQLTAAPRWCATDLRDGNQALANPMDAARKRRMFDLLVRLGFKEIEVAFPAASKVEFDFVRHLLEDGIVPEDVTLQVMTPARPELILRTFEALRGAPRAIVHLYNATAPLFRRLVFGNDEDATVALAVSGARCVREAAERQPGTRWTFQYSPETFCFTEPEFVLRVCEAVLDVWAPTPERPAILNLPATVEVSTPNVYADQIEWFCGRVSRRDRVVVSLHPHNDRGTAVAAAELALLAGAERVEGCLFGNGERTGNVDLVTLAMNLYARGIDPRLDFSDLAGVVATVEACNDIGVHPRHPYAGELVYTAFSGSHQDAIRKGFAAREGRPDGVWEVPYLPIDPADVGRTYEAVIRVNSQSGKGGAAWIVERMHGLRLPRPLQVAFGKVIQELADRERRELTADEIASAFDAEYLATDGDPLELVTYSIGRPEGSGAEVTLGAQARVLGTPQALHGRGNGPISAAAAALERALQLGVEIVGYEEHALEAGADGRAAAYVEVRDASGRPAFGAGVDPDTTTAALRAVFKAVGRLLLERETGGEAVEKPRPADRPCTAA